MSLSRQFLIFLLIGGLSTCLHYAILVLLVRFDWLAPVWASGLGFCIGAVFNYLLNRRLTFSSKRTHRRVAPRFVVVATSGLMLNTVLIALLNGLAGWHYLSAQIFATGATLVWNFVLHKIWTFSGAKSQRLHSGGKSA